MSLTVLDALGHTAALADTENGLITGSIDAVLVKGHSGTGKTTFATELANRLAIRSFQAIFLKGDMGRTHQEYYPFLNLLRSRSWLREGKEVIKAAADELPAGRGIVKRAIDLLATYSSTRHASPALLYDQVASEILTALRGRARRTKVLLVLDDIHAFDKSTIKFLHLIFQSPKEYLGKKCGGLAIVASENTEESPANPSADRESFIAGFRTVALQRCQRHQLPKVLAAIGLEDELPEPMLDQLHRGSGGHLRVLAELVKYISTGPPAQSLYDHSDLLELILNLRLSEPGSVQHNIRSLLARVSVVGSTFMRVEIQCLLDEISAGELIGALKKSIELGIIDEDGPLLSFQHTTIRNFFLNLSLDSHPAYHQKFAECLRVLRPSDYSARVFHLDRAQESREADVLRVLRWARANRTSGDTPTPSFERADYTDIVDALRVAHRMMTLEDYRSAIDVLEAIHDAYPEVVLAERDVTLAECYLEDITYAAFRRAYTLLSRWDKKLEVELELRARLAYHSIMAVTLMAEYPAASERLTALLRDLARVRATDPGLQRIVNRIELVSDSLHRIEVGGRRIYSALQKLLEAKESGSFFNPFDLYVGLVNYSGNQIITGEYERAAEYAFHGTKLRNEYSEIPFPTASAALNNHLVADLLAHRSSPEETAAGLERVLETASQFTDVILVSVNYANILLLQGNSLPALEYLSDVRKRLEDVGECDEYYAFYTGHAYAAALLLSGRRGEASTVWESIEALIPKLPPGLQEYLPHRHKLLAAGFRDPGVRHVEDWQRYLDGVTSHRGRPWRFFRNALLFTDIQIWFHF